MPFHEHVVVVVVFKALLIRIHLNKVYHKCGMQNLLALDFYDILKILKTFFNFKTSRAR